MAADLAGHRRLSRERANEPASRLVDHRRGFGRRLLLSRRYRRLAAFPGYADPPARADQGGQSWPGACRPWLAAARQQSAGRSQAGLRVAARAARRRDRVAVDCARRPSFGTAGMNMAPLVDGSLVVLILAVAIWTIAVRDSF